MTIEWIEELKNLLGDCVCTDEATLQAHAGDKWHAEAMPQAVVLATATGQVSAALRFAHERGIPVTPRGAGVGYVGGCVPVQGGIVISVAGMTRILEVNPGDGVAVAEAGVLTADLQAACAEAGWFNPPDPASRKESSIGGNIATNAGGPRCLKYGVTRAYVLGLAVVLADGRVLRCGGRTHKNKQGFDLVGLFCGSEGMLGIVTEATLRIIPAPPARAALHASFPQFALAAAAVQNTLQGGHLPCAIEITDAFTLAVIGDGAFTGGMIHEALNNITPGLRLIIILNENEMSISKNIGRFATHMARIRRKSGYFKTKKGISRFIKRIPLIGNALFCAARDTKKAFKNALYGSNYFEDLGLYYLGPADGNDYEAVEALLTEAKKQGDNVVIHLKTRKGKGYAPAEAEPGRYHGMPPAGTVAKENFSHRLGEILIRESAKDDRICAITAAMSEGTGLESFREAFRLHVDVLEFDVHMCRDGHLVVLHDDMVDRTTDGTGDVHFKTLAEIKQLDAGVKFGFPGLRIPTLREALECIVADAYQLARRQDRYSR